MSQGKKWTVYNRNMKNRYYFKNICSKIFELRNMKSSFYSELVKIYLSLPAILNSQDGDNNSAYVIGGKDLMSSK